MKVLYTTPSGTTYNLYADMLKQSHLLIAGATGSGKSVVINGILSTALYNAPTESQFILIDPKRVELSIYRNLPHTLFYASEPAAMTQALQYALNIIDSRYSEMQRIGLRKYEGSDIYIVIDELADLMTTQKKAVTPLLQRICQIGRASKVHVIAATQCPLAEVIPTKIKVNFDARVALRTASAQHSRNIMECSGCEKLPAYGQGFYIKPLSTELYNIPMIADNEIIRLVNHWGRKENVQKQIFGNGKAEKGRNTNGQTKSKRQFLWFSWAV